MDEITLWNIEHTDILEVLRRKVQEEMLISWSKALSIGIRMVFKGPGYSRGNPEYEALRDLYQFIVKQRIKLMGNPTMKGGQRGREYGLPFGLYHLWDKGFAEGNGISGNHEYHEVEALGEAFEVNPLPAMIMSNGKGETANICPLRMPCLARRW